MAPSSLSSCCLLAVLLLLAIQMTTSAAAPAHHDPRLRRGVYIILVKPRKDFETMDDRTREKYHSSFLPNKARHSQHLFDGFAAWLAEKELAAAFLPGQDTASLHDPYARVPRPQKGS
jgi:hypothetical protein